MQLSGARIHISGIVQGVGFRPFVYALALRLGLNGWVRNTSAGVDIEVDGSQQQLDAFIAALRAEAPPLSHIDSLEAQFSPPNGFTAFEIVHSQAVEAAFQPISPDVCICPDCLRELFDPADRRYRYPFINCTNCGPRFTIIQDIPYDRPNTTMARLPHVPRLRRRISRPARPAFPCPAGSLPGLRPAGLAGTQSGMRNRSVRAMRPSARPPSGCRRARSSRSRAWAASTWPVTPPIPQAVETLRQRKLRVDKPFALMLPDLAAVAAALPGEPS